MRRRKGLREEMGRRIRSAETVIREEGRESEDMAMALRGEKGRKGEGGRN